jgi:hypothetical protein
MINNNVIVKVLRKQLVQEYIQYGIDQYLCFHKEHKGLVNYGSLKKRIAGSLLRPEVREQLLELEKRENHSTCAKR